jgi:molybdopterin synthase sulfur carrier subunit
LSVVVRIPTPLQKLTGNQGEVRLEGNTLAEIIDALEATYPGIKERLCEEDGRLRRFVNIYVNEEDARFMDGLDTAVKDGDEISIVPAIAGG